MTEFLDFWFLFEKFSALLLWFKPSQKPHPTHLLTCAPRSRICKRIGRAQAAKLMGQDKGSLVGKTKATHTSKAKQEVNYGFWSTGHIQEDTAPSSVTVTLQDKCHHSSFFPPTLYPLVTLGHLSHFAPHHPCQCASKKAEKALAPCKLCSAATKTSLYCQPYVQLKSRTLSHTSHHEGNKLFHSKVAHSTPYSIPFMSYSGPTLFNTTSLNTTPPFHPLI